LEDFWAIGAALPSKASVAGIMILEEMELSTPESFLIRLTTIEMPTTHGSA
jgi:hypothetical protein